MTKRLAVGILAHVDSGKTTLSEALLYRAGALRRLGRVDHKDAFLDTDALERARGITIFAKQAVLDLPGAHITLLDTPGHVDFSAEAERTLQVLDYAVLVISGTDGVQSHTETLWKLLARYRVPTFFFVNKCDLPGADAAVRLRELRGRFGDGCVDFTAAPDPEALALCSDVLMERVLAGERFAADDADLVTAVARRELFPCYFGAALRLDGVDALLQGLQTLTRQPRAAGAFAARVFKIGQDEQNARLTWLKVTGGALHVKDAVGAEKADQLRLYSGAKYRLIGEALPGDVVAVTGPQSTRAGQGLGAAADAPAPLLEPVLNYCVRSGADPHALLRALQILEQEDPQLRVVWQAAAAEVHVQLMGEVQLEVLQSLLLTRFGIKAAFGEGGILYKETLDAAAEGVGHYEPLRHYAEVRLLLEPAPRGSGITLAAACRPDTLAENWQRLILTHLAERSHPGVLLGAPLTDVKITLTAGRAHLKHTEGGDFRQATYRAVRQGLRTAAAQGHAVLLEPWYSFSLTLPQDCVGRAMTDIQRMSGVFDPPTADGDAARLTGRVPVSAARGYAREVAAYTHGTGRWAAAPAGYAPCHNAAEVLAAAGYDPDADVENPADSVFCSHGAGCPVPWAEVPSRAHTAPGLPRGAADEGGAAQDAAPRRRAAAYRGTLEQDKELLAIFERTYGPIRRRGQAPGDAQKAARAALHTAPEKPLSPAAPPEKSQTPETPAGRRPAPAARLAANAPDALPPAADGDAPEYLLVDGYNVIFAWDDLRRMAADNLEAARRRLTDVLINYAAYRRCVPILVFDAYKVKGGVRAVEQHHNLYVVYTREAETADMYIERATHRLARRCRTRVVTSDGTEQLIVLGNGALRLSARAFEQEVRTAEAELRAYLTE